MLFSVCSCFYEKWNSFTKSGRVNVRQAYSLDKATALHTLDFGLKHFNIIFRSLLHGTGVEVFLVKLNIEFLLAL